MDGGERNHVVQHQDQGGYDSPMEIQEIEEEAADAGDGDELFKSDHEFSCESDDSDDYQPVKHARTATKVDFKIAYTQLIIFRTLEIFPTNNVFPYYLT